MSEMSEEHPRGAVFTAKYRGQCGACPGAIVPGEQVLQPRKGATRVHARCAERLNVRSAQRIEESLEALVARAEPLIRSIVADALTQTFLPATVRTLTIITRPLRRDFTPKQFERAATRNGFGVVVSSVGNLLGLRDVTTTGAAYGGVYERIKGGVRCNYRATLARALRARRADERDRADRSPLHPPGSVEVADGPAPRRQTGVLR